MSASPSSKYRRQVRNTAIAVVSRLEDVAYWDAHGWPSHISRERITQQIADFSEHAMHAAVYAARLDAYIARGAA